jgi:hypothetical protein
VGFGQCGDETASFINTMKQHDFETRLTLKHGYDERSPAFCPQDRHFSHLTKDGLATHLPGNETRISTWDHHWFFKRGQTLTFHHDRCCQVVHSCSQLRTIAPVFCQVEHHTKVIMLHQRCNDTI